MTSRVSTHWLIKPESFVLEFSQPVDAEAVEVVINNMDGQLPTGVLESSGWEPTTEEFASDNHLDTTEVDLS